MAKKYRKLTKAQRALISKCISKYSADETNKDRLVAKCHSMERKGTLAKDGKYKK